MSKRVFFALCAFAGVCAFAQSGRTIQVDVSYTGSATVDAGHKIYVALSESADFSSGPPAATKSLDAKQGAVTFTDVQNVPVYVTTAFDPIGAWDAQSPPPSGTRMGMYTVHPPAPEPIKVEPGKTARVKITFDDTNKVLY